MKCKPSFILTLFILLFSNSTLAQNQSMLCESLERLSIPDTTITSAQWIEEGEFQTPGPVLSAEVPGFCRVELTVSPAIDIEVWLPSANNWNARYKAVGGGGLAGIISYNAMIPSIQQHYVTSSTDTGHKASDLSWLSDAGRLRDYGYRAIHEMALKSKIVIGAFYNRDPDYSYFNGCSTGGRQGLMEAQRYPDDFDGIVSGAPVNYFVANHYTQLWVSQLAKPSDSSIFEVADLELITQEVLEQCDAIDGVNDGVLENPMACAFDPSPLSCENSSDSACLSEPQLDALAAIYQGPVHEVTGEVLHGAMVPGGESPEGYPGSWMLTVGDGVFPIPDFYFSRAVFNDPDWDWRSLNFGSDIDLAYQKTGPILDAINPNLDNFQSQGGKLLMYHGWNDPGVFPGSSVHYLEQVIDKLPLSTPEDAAEAAGKFLRLFMVPGMAHCSGGPGTDQFDMQSALENWVENGNAPESIEASHLENGQVSRSRPLCPYPQTAVYDGSGSTDEISNFSCQLPQ